MIEGARLSGFTGSPFSRPKQSLDTLHGLWFNWVKQEQPAPGNGTKDLHG
jgi:hypothetical protein